MRPASIVELFLRELDIAFAAPSFLSHMSIATFSTDRARIGHIRRNRLVSMTMAPAGRSQCALSEGSYVIAPQ